jgi:drug/metabolite transporter (DMT)-like permease
MTDRSELGAVRTVLYTTLALVAFAANSVLCRLALGSASLDAASFTTIRLISGAVALVLIAALAGARRQGAARAKGNWISGWVLFAYAAAFSFAYLDLAAGTGALILFGAVQVTMIAAALLRGERPRALEWLGLWAALGGLVYLVSPGLTAPSVSGSALMGLAGVAWGVYSLRGGGAGDAIWVTRDNFVLAVPPTLLVSLVAITRFEVSAAGVLWAAISGAVTSGAGYAVWYTALRGLTATRAATVQLSVPVLAAAAGVGLLGEQVSFRLLVSAVLILGGIGLSLIRNRASTG